jgi:hypothetical protein
MNVCVISVAFLVLLTSFGYSGITFMNLCFTTADYPSFLTGYLLITAINYKWGSVCHYYKTNSACNLSVNLKSKFVVG